ncbi:FAD-dependent oxidoreductase [Paeniroseomonas aquatica]|uniref:FAD-dependent oxidoreductase n=1 Tax=Paeniroseomonas aquatica TaxID=373043 RepID=UPI00361E2D8D
MIGTVIIGAGPAGCAAAIALARAGQEVLLLERSPAPREVVCGEFLGVDAAAALAVLGLDPAALGGIPLRRVAVGHGARTAAAPLPFAAWGLSRLRLDGALQAAAGPALRRGVTVLGASPVPGGWRLRTSAGEVAARRVILASGKHGLRGFPGRPRPGSASSCTSTAWRPATRSPCCPSPAAMPGCSRRKGRMAKAAPTSAPRSAAGRPSCSPPWRRARRWAPACCATPPRAGTGRWRSPASPTASAWPPAGRPASTASATRPASSRASPGRAWRWRCTPAWPPPPPSWRGRRPRISTPPGAAAAPGHCAGPGSAPGRCGWPRPASPRPPGSPRWPGWWRGGRGWTWRRN